MKKLKKVWSWVLGMLYPKTCCFCGEISEKEMCSACAKKVVYVGEPRCKKCGKPIRYEEQEYCQDCVKQDFYYEQGRSLWLHKEPVSSSVYRFKYQNLRIYGEFYAKEMFRLYGEVIRKWEIDLIIPVPLHWRRRMTRGYNQSEVIAKYLGEYTGIPVDRKAVRRNVYTEPQKQLDNKERRRNLRHAFEVKRRWESPRRILLIDDIYTTGSTIDAISQVLCEKGRNKVWFLTISIGQDF